MDSELENDNVMEDLITNVNRMYEEAKLKQIKSEVLGDLRKEQKTIIEDQFKGSLMQIQNLPISSPSFENNILKTSH